MSSKSGNTVAGRDAKLEAIRRQNDADKRRSRIIAIVTGVVVLALVAAIAVVIAIAAREESVQAGADPAGLVTVESAEGQQVEGVALGPDDSDVTVTIFEDFLCPVCNQLEQTSGSFIDALPDQGVRVVYSPVSILDRLSQGTEYSTRSGSAAMCVADSDGPETFAAFKKLLFANQPAENTEGLTNEQLGDLAAQAGASQEAQDCVGEGAYEGWMGRSTRAWQDAGGSGTPTVWVNGEPVQDWSPNGLTAAITAAGGTLDGGDAGAAEPSAAAE